MMVAGARLFALGVLGVALLGCDQAEPQVLPQVAPEVDVRKEAAIRELMEVSNAGGMGKQVMEQMGVVLSQQFDPDFAVFWKEFSASVNEQDLENMIVPIYARHFETSEIEEIIRFNKTPLGQKFIKEMPAIVQESMTVGMEWGQTLAKQALETYKQRENK